MDKIPFVDLATQYRSIKAEADAAVLKVFERGDFILGSDVTAFEQEFAAYCETSHCLGVANGNPGARSRRALDPAGLRPRERDHGPMQPLLHARSHEPDHALVPAFVVNADTGRHVTLEQRDSRVDQRQRLGVGPRLPGLVAEEGQGRLVRQHRRGAAEGRRHHAFDRRPGAA